MTLLSVQVKKSKSKFKERVTFDNDCFKQVVKMVAVMNNLLLECLSSSLTSTNIRLIFLDSTGTWQQKCIGTSK